MYHGKNGNLIKAMDSAVILLWKLKRLWAVLELKKPV